VNSGASSTTQSSATITPGSASDFVIFGTNANAATTPTGFTNITGGLFYRQVSNDSPITVTTNIAGPGVDEFANAIASFATTGTPTQEQSLSFGDGGIGN